MGKNQRRIKGDHLENAKSRMELVCSSEVLVLSAVAIEQKPSEPQSACVALPFSHDVESQRYAVCCEAVLFSHSREQEPGKCVQPQNDADLVLNVGQMCYMLF